MKIVNQALDDDPLESREAEIGNIRIMKRNANRFDGALRELINETHRTDVLNLKLELMKTHQNQTA